MSIADSLVPEMEFEAATTRRLLERVPEAKFDYRPHPKSMNLRELASHIAEAYSWTGPTMDMDVMEMDPDQWKPFVAKSKAELLSTFDRNVADALAAVRGTPDAKMMVTWSMKRKDGSVAFAMPRIAVLRGFVVKHTVHHRGQLTVYLRMLDVPLPQTYGPSADEPNM